MNDTHAGHLKEAHEHDTAPQEHAQHEKRMIFAVLAYLGVLVLIPYFMAKEDPFVFFHVKQGAALFGVEVLLWIVVSFLWLFPPLFIVFQIIELIILVLAILGIINAVQGKTKELPHIGSFAARLPL
jgi:uncharacterized membrane protein